MNFVGTLSKKVMSNTGRQKGFTLVELLVVIVIIAILATVTFVAYNGIQGRARDAGRAQALQQLETALATYYSDNGQYPVSMGSTTINSGWSTTADASWSNLVTALQPYLGNVPSDPIATPGQSVISLGTAYDFAYFSNPSGSYCGAGKNQMYLIVYRFEDSAPPKISGSGCTTGTALGPYTAGSNLGNYYMIASSS